MLDTKLNMSWQGTLSAKMTNSIPGCIKRTTARRLREVIINVLYSALDRSHLKCCMRFWAPKDKKDVNQLELFYRRATNKVWFGTRTRAL